ncbi:aminoglycoside phosphotransferase family protein [Pseudoprimorskyibacter insulae]|uniref:Aminoglycoside phosphotransferase domain-containing protein n=1 Tax=Pseudoprimorskyibacter insulae TaxID=1695997 RepID=A0A2R8ATZ4_9RHOB|nr:phosphotransferase [Pseudoprimorskyibacter insulae]SPF79532.1 hypothetical protein PRI8871_01328 [Pseudoprimorskyibacter insulae]
MTATRDFLQTAGWDGATVAPLAQDASSRSYTRLTGPQGTAILMEDPDGDAATFARLARHLTGIGLSAPRILADDAGRGLLLIEDLGDGLFARLAEAAPTQEAQLYAVAADALAEVQAAPAPQGLPVADPDTLADMIAPGVDLYLPDCSAGAKADLTARFAEALHRHAPDPSVMIMRDYHAENLLWLPDRDGAARAGLLDFQDAMLGHPAYDLASLLLDARRVVSQPVQQETFRRFLDRTGHAADAFGAAFAVLGAQRNLRILGIFVRLAQARGKPHYLDLIPRVQADLQICLDHPATRDIADLLRPALPDPTPDFLRTFRT